MTKKLTALLTVTGAILFGALKPVFAFQPPTREPVPNFDSRRVTSLSTNDPVRTNRDVAADRLRGRLPKVRVDFDQVLNTPKMVAGSDGLLSGPNGRGRGISDAAAASIPANDPHHATKAFLKDYEQLFGHGPEALAKARVKRDFVAEHNGMRTTVWQQLVDDIPVFEAVLVSHVTKRGELVNLSGGFLADPEQAANIGAGRRGRARRTETQITAREAVVRAARNLGEKLEASDVAPEGAEAAGPEKRQKFTAAVLAGESEVRLAWLPMSESVLRLNWEVFLTSKARGEMFRVLVDAETGEVPLRHCLTEYISPATYRVFTSDSPSPFSPGHATPLTNQPPVVSRGLVTTNALSKHNSPNGWINDGGNETLGNNVDAHLDRNADDYPDYYYDPQLGYMYRPQGSPFRAFDFPLDLGQPPVNSAFAAVVQLFYWNNWMHDRLYELGFTEAAGNFQTTNFNRGGFGNDAVQADAQDGGGYNNANFATPPDGTAPRMQMYEFNGSSPGRDGDFDAEIVLHEYAHGLSNRRVGGGVGLSTFQSRGMGEGWSDFYALTLLSNPDDDVNASYAAGAYAAYQLNGLAQNYYFGIRRYPYSTDLTKNPLTFKDIDYLQESAHAGIPRNPVIGGSGGEVHNQGEVWCSALWQARANLITKLGFAAGNQLILQLVTDGMNLSPPNPNFIQARDAILQADLVLTGGANFNELWAAFVKRGLGILATSPASSATVGVHESFDFPDDLRLGSTGTLTFVGPAGGPFSPSCQIISFHNAGTNTLVWTASTGQPWVSVSQSNGNLSAGDSSTVSVCPAVAANFLSPGVYNAVAVLSNTVTTMIQTQGISLSVIASTDVTQLAFFPLDTDPGWSRQGLWAFGTPTGLGGAHGQPDPTAGATGTNVFGYNLNGDYPLVLGGPFYLTTGAFDFQGYAGLRLKFKRWLNSDRPPWVFATLEISNDGTNWTKIWTNSATIANAAWSQVSYDITPYADNRTNVSVRWGHRLGQVSGAWAYSGWNIDDVEFTGYAIPLSLTISIPPSAAEGDGVLTGTVTASAAPATNLVVNLISSDVTEADAPTSVTILAGETNAVFNLTVLDDAELDGPRTATIGAQAADYGIASATISVLDNETAVLQVSLPVTVSEGSGTVQGRLQIPVAPTANFVAFLSSSDTNAIRVPASVLFPAGQTSVVITATIVDDPKIDGPQSAIVTAHVPAWTDGIVTTTVFDNESTNLMVTGFVSVAESSGTISNWGLISLAGTLPTNLVVSLASGDTNKATVPAQVIILAGQTSNTFNLTAVDNSILDGDQNVLLTASAAGLGNGTVAVIVQDDELLPSPSNPGPHDGSTNVPANAARLTWSNGKSGELIVNCGFETGDFTGWVRVTGSNGNFVINDGKLDPPAFEGPLPPFAGNFDAVAVQTGTVTNILYQEVTIPPEATSATLSWMQRGRTQNENSFFSVEIRDKDDTVLTNAYTAPYGSRSYAQWKQQTYDLGVFIGRTIRVTFYVEAYSNGANNLYVDNVSLIVGGALHVVSNAIYFGTSPVLGASDLVGSTTNSFWSLPLLEPATTYYWQLVAQHPGLATNAGPVWSFTTRGVHHFDVSPVMTPQIVNGTFELTVTAKDEFDRMVTNFSGGAALRAASLPYAATSPVVISEVKADVEYEDAPSFIEFANVSDRPVDVGGWQVTIYGASDWPNPAVTFTIPTNTTVAGGDVFRLEEYGRLPDTYPFFGTGANYASLWQWASGVSYDYSKSAVLLTDASGTPRDFFSGRYANSLEITNPITIPTALWNGSSPLDPTTLYPNWGPWSRVGNQNHHDAQDWVVASANRSPGVLNLGMTVPFVGFDVPIPISPTNLGTFAGGVWTGAVSVLAISDGASLIVTDVAGHSGTGNRFAVLGTNDLSVTITATPEPATAGANVDYVVTVANAGPASASGVTLTNVLSPFVNLVGIALTNGTAQVSNGIVICDLGTIGAGAAVAVGITVSPHTVATLTNVVTVGHAEPDSNPANNSAVAFTSVSPPFVSIVDASVTEGDLNETNAMVFDVRLSSPSTRTLTFTYMVTSHTAILGKDHGVPEGYSYFGERAYYGEVSFPSGMTSAPIHVKILGDTLVEGNEEFRIRLFHRNHALLADAEAVGTILDDDVMPGELDHFALSSVASTQTVGVPFALTISALDRFNNPATNFQGLVSLTGWRSALGRSLLAATFESGLQGFTTNNQNWPVSGGLWHRSTGRRNNPGHSASNSMYYGRSETTSGGGNYNANSSGSAVRHAGNLASPSINVASARQPLTLSFNTLMNIRPDPGYDQALVEYSTDEGSTYSVLARKNEPKVFAHYTTNSWVSDSLELPPITNSTIQFRFSFDTLDWPPSGSYYEGWYLDDILVTEAPDLLPMEPVLALQFTNGAWNGQVTVLDACTNGVLLADDGHGHRNLSSAFTALFVDDLAVRVSGTPRVVAVGNPIAYTIEVTNTGPNAADGVWVTNNLPNSVTLTLVTLPQGNWTSTGGTVVCDLGTIPAGTSLTLSVSALAVTSAAVATNVVSVGRLGLEFFTNNNVAAATNIIAAATLAVRDTATTEIPGGSALAVFSVSLFPPTLETVAVSFVTSNGTAIAGSDYAATNGVLTFAPGQTNLIITVAVLDDTQLESNETFFVNLSQPTNAMISIGTGSCVITDTPPVLFFTSTYLEVSEGGLGGTQAVFEVQLTRASSEEIRVDVATSDNSAIAPLDYFATNLTLVFPPGTTSQTVTVTIVGNFQIQPYTKDFWVVLSNLVNARFYGVEYDGIIYYDDYSRVSILDDDFPPMVTSQPTNMIAAPCQTVTLHVAVSGSPPLAYQWQRNGQPLQDGISPLLGDISGAHSETLIISNLQATAAGLYSVVVTNPVFSAESADASLTVPPGTNRMPVVTIPIPDQTNTYGSAFNYALPASSFSDPDICQTLSYSANGLPSGIGFDGSSRTFSGTPTNVGPYAVTVTATDDGAPPLSTNTVFNFVIIPELLTVTADNTNRFFGQANPSFTGTLTGVTNNDNITATFSTTATPVSPPGDYPITPELQDPDSKLGNYTVTTNLGVLTVLCPTNFIVTITNDSGPGSLREAIALANESCASSPVLIGFNIPGAGVQTIAPLTVLPIITRSVTLDGYTQPGASPNTLANTDNAVLRVELCGTNLASDYGLRFNANDCTVRGLVINGFSAQVVLESSTNGVIEGNFLGTDATGVNTNAMGSVNGLLITGGANHRVGGLTPASRNVISGNWYVGVNVVTGTGLQILGNFIGICADGSSFPLTGWGVYLTDCTQSQVGGSLAEARNVIASHSTGCNVYAGGSNVIQGNFIGTDASGTLPRGNIYGIALIDSVNNLIGGADGGAGNLISGNGSGVVVEGVSASNNIVAGNRIGTDVTGTNALGNTYYGVYVSSLGNIIGGINTGAGNVISGNGAAGVAITQDVATNNAVLGNSIFANGALGIDLDDNGVTPNDPGDADGSPNHFQNFPEMLSALYSNGVLHVSYQVDSTAANSAYPLTVEFFISDGSGEGRALIHRATYSTPQATTSIAFTPLAALTFANRIVATATDANGNTSEFSAEQSLAGWFTVASIADSGPGSLRQAILDANADASPEPVTIAFNIPGVGVQTLLPLSGLPVITRPVTIDGYTQPGASPNTLALGSDAVLLIEMHGTNFLGSSGLYLAASASNSVVRGLVINRCTYGIALEASETILEGNFIGTDATGTNAQPNDIGIAIGGAGNWIGGLTPGARNVISGNTSGRGIWITTGTSNLVVGNYVGLGADGTTPLPNAAGIYVSGSSTGNQIGGSTPNARNVISANGHGCYDDSIGGNVFSGNFIGTDASGTLARGNIGGITVLTMGVIGGTNAGAGNLLSGWNSTAVNVGSSNVVAGNLIGTDVTGRLALGNEYDGVLVSGFGNLIGGTTPAARNVIAANRYGIFFFQPTANNNRVLGNFIGTDVTGTNGLGNAAGIVSLYAPLNVIGGPAAAEGNVISASTNGAIEFIEGATNNIVQGNFIGTDVTGTASLPNGHGIGANTTGNLIGGTGAGEGNVISGNTGIGVAVGETNNAVLGNRIYANGALGIDLFGDGVTPNDPGDADGSPNHFQNFPEITSAALAGGNLTVRYRVDSAVANSAYPLTVEFFLADSVASGEGRTFIHRHTYDTAQDFTNITFTPAAMVNDGDPLVATATDANGNTSEFSAVATATSNRSPIVANPIPEQNGTYGFAFSFAFATNVFTDPDTGQTLTYTASNLPPGIAFDGATRTFSGTNTDVGTNTILVAATDDGLPPLSTSDTFDIFVDQAPLTISANNTNRPYGEADPTFTGTLVGVTNSDNLTATFTTTATPSSPPGDYDIIPALQDPNSRLGNYIVTTNLGTLTVNGVTLEFSLSSGSPSFCWPITAAAFLLEYTDDLTPPVTWQSVTSGITTNAPNICLTVAPEAATPLRFYRLRLP